MILCCNLGALRPYLLHVHLNFLILTLCQLWGTTMLSPPRVPPVILKWALSFTQDKGSQMLLDTIQAAGLGPNFANMLNMLPHLGICFGICLG